MTSTIIETALALSRWVELSILGKATILMALGLTAAWLAGRSRASMRHLLLAATFATLIALPLIAITAPAVTIEVPGSDSSAPSIGDFRAAPSSNAFMPTSSGPERQSTPSWPTMVRWGWIAGAILLLMPLAIDLWRLRRIRREGLPWLELRERTRSLAKECGVRRSVEVLLHENVAAPLTCGVWRPAIVLPSDAREWSNADLRRALVHELEHVRRSDWAIQLAARATCACYWFHPLVWVAWRRLCLEAERACDDAVLQSAKPTDYAEQLVLLARRLSIAPARATLGMANRSDLSTRVSALLDRSQRRGRAGLLAAASAIAVASLVVIAIAPVRAVAQSTNSSRSTPLDRALFEAAEDGDTTVINALLNAGANVNGVLKGDGSPLIGAARKGGLAAVRLLLDRGADPNMPVTGDGNPLIMAAREGHIDVVTLLLDRGARVDEIVPTDENALIQASGNGKLQVVKLLVSRGANVNTRVWAEREWRSPLIMARKGGHAAVVSFLLASGARE